jgi:hypothetical protein
MAICTARETGITCEGCGGEFGLGEEYLYWYGRKLHQGCASADAAVRRGAEEGAVSSARSILASGARVVLSRSQLRDLIRAAVAAGLEPVRKPDAGRQRWYGRMSGWSAERVHAGLAASEVAGLWSDFLDAGRMPPLRGQDLSAIMDVIDSRAHSVIADDVDRNVTPDALTGNVTDPLPGSALPS